MKRKLYVLANNVWNADDYLNNRNTNPVRTDLYLFASKEECEKQVKNFDVEDDIYNDAFICSKEMEEEEILELSGFENIEDFNEALAEPYSTNPNVKNLGEFEKTDVAAAVMEDYDEEFNVESVNYDFDKTLERSILVFWSWERYIGYARNFIELRPAYSDETEAMLVKQDKVFATQCDIALTADEIAESSDVKESLLKRLSDNTWKWTNPEAVKRSIDNF